MKLTNIIKSNILFKAGSLYLLGNIFDKAILFLTIPIFTRILSTSDFGIVSTYLSWVSILSLIVGLSLGSSLRSGFVDFKDELDDYISSIFFLALLNFIFTSIIILLITFFFVNELDITLVVLCLVQSFMTFISTTLNVKLMMQMDYVKRTILLVFPNVVITIFSIVLVMQMNENIYMGRIIPYVLVSVLIGCFILFESFKKSGIFYHKKYWSYGLRVSFPLIFHGLSLSLLAVSDRSFLIYFTGASETGIYSLIYSVGMIPMVVISSIESLWIPWFTKKMEINDKLAINKHVKNYIQIGLITVVVVLLISPELIELMSPKEFWSGKKLVPPILLSSFIIFMYSISVDLEYYYKSTKIIAFYTIIAAVLNLLLNYILIPTYGAQGAAYSTAISYFVIFLLHCYSARKIDKDLFPLKIYIKPFIFIVLFIVFSFIFANIPILRWGMIIVIGLFFYLTNRKIISNFKKK